MLQKLLGTTSGTNESPNSKTKSQTLISEPQTFKIVKGNSVVYTVVKNRLDPNIFMWVLRSFLNGIYFFIREPTNMFYLLTGLLIVIFGEDTSVYPGNLLLAQVFGLFFVTVVSEIYYEMKRFRLTQSIGGFKYKRLKKAILKKSNIRVKKQVYNEEITSENISIGDIIKLKKYQVCPVDCIILACPDTIDSEYVCHVDCSLNKGVIQREKRWAVRLTRSFSHLILDPTKIDQFFDRISGKVQIFPFSANSSSFKGTFKLKNDPKIENLDDSNLITQGTIIRSPKVYCLVTHVGTETTHFAGASISRGKRSSSHQLIRNYAYLTITINLVLTLVSTITLFVRIGNNEIFSNIDPNISNGMRFITFLILYAPIVPISLLLMLEVASMITSIRIESKYYNFQNSKEFKEIVPDFKSEAKVEAFQTTFHNKSHKEEMDLKKMVKVINSQILSDLGCTDHMFFDKTGTLLTNDYELATVSSRSKIYQSENKNFLNPDLKKEITNNRQERKGKESGSPFNKGRSTGKKQPISDLDVSEGIEDGGVKNSRYSQMISNTEKNPLSSRSRNSKQVPVQTEGEALISEHSRASNTNTGASNAFLANMKRKEELSEDILSNKFNEYDFLRDVDSDAEIIEIMKAFTLLHKSQITKNDFDCKLIEEKAMLRFAKNFGYEFNLHNHDLTMGKSGNMAPRKLDLTFDGVVTERFEVPLINEYHKVRQRFSLVAFNPQEETYTLYVRGSVSEMDPIMNYGNSKQSAELTIRHNGILGLQTFIYAKRELTHHEFECFRERYISYKKNVIDQQINMLKLANDMESNLELISIVGLKSRVNTGAIETLDELKKMGIRVSMLTGDDYTHSKMAMNILGLANERHDDIHVLSFEDEDSGIVKVRDILDDMRKKTEQLQKVERSESKETSKIQKQTTVLNRTITQLDNSELEELNKIILMFSADAFDVIKSSTYLTTHFFFICQFAKSIIGFDLEAHHKADFVEGFRYSNLGREKIVTVVGDGLNDLKMMKKANVGVQLASVEVPVIFGDVIISSLPSLVPMMRHECRELHSSLKQLTMMVFGHSTIGAAINFLFQFYCSFTGAPVLQYTLLSLADILSNFQMFIFAAFERKYPIRLQKLLPALYSEKQFVVKESFKHLLYEYLLAIMEAVIMFYFVIYSYVDVIDEKGHTGNMNMVYVTIAFAYSTVFSIKFIYRAEILTWLHTLIMFLKMIFIVGIYGLSGALPTINSPIYYVAFMHLFGNYNALYVFCFTTLGPVVLGWLVWDSLLKFVYFPIDTKIKKVIAAGDCETLIEDGNKMIMEQFSEFENFSSIVTNCFSNRDEIDLIIEEILSQKGSDKILINKPFLSFHTAQLERKFGLYSAKKFILGTRIQYIGCWFISSVVMALLIVNNPTTQIFLTNIGVIVLMGIVALFSLTLFFKIHVRICAILFTAIIIVGSAFESLVSISDYTMVFIAVTLLITSNYNLSFKELCYFIVPLSFFYLAITYPNSTMYNSTQLDQTILEPNTDNSQVQVFSTICLSASAAITMLILTIQRYKKEKLIKNIFKSGSSIQNQSSITKELLGLLLPKFILDKMNNYQVTDIKIGEHVSNIAILFCDIADFNRVIAEQEKDIVRILDELFRRFDEMCIRHGIQKVETVGKTYLAVSGLEVVENSLPSSLKAISHETRLLQLAKDMMESIKDDPNKLNLKIGIHYGNAMMCVIGYHKPQFSLIGDTVNTTSRHCSTGKPGHIMMSKEAWKHVDVGAAVTDGYKYQIVPTYMKGKGENVLIDVYHVFKKQSNLVSRIKGALTKSKRTNTNGKRNSVEITALDRFFEKKRISNKPGFFKFNDIVKQATEKLDIMKDLQDLQESQNKKSAKSGRVKKNSMQKNNSIMRGPGGERNENYEDSENDAREEIIELSSDEEEEETLKPNILMQIQSKNMSVVERFYHESKKTNRGVSLVSHLIFILYLAVEAIFFFVLRDGVQDTQSTDDLSDVKYYAVIGFKVLTMILMALVALSSSMIFSGFGKYLYIICYWLIFGSSLASFYLLGGFTLIYVGHLQTIEYTIILILCLETGVFDFLESCIVSLIAGSAYICLLLFQYFVEKESISTEPVIQYIGFLSLVIFLLLINVFTLIRSQIENFNSNSLGAKKIGDMIDFIERLMPKHMRKAMKTQQESLGENLENVTLLYADIKGFTAYSNSHTPPEVVELVSNLFTSFDKSCNELNLYKVYTIGDCYVVMSFVDKNDRRAPQDEAYDMLRFGFMMLEIIAQVRIKVQFPDLKMRIGLHTGDIIGGVVGTGIIRYDLYGQDVQIANAMESEGKPDFVKVSKATKDLLDKISNNGLYFERQEDVTMKKLNNRSIENYLVEMDGFQSTLIYSK